jgi:hypothetical protein
MLLPSIKFEITSNKTPEQIESLLKEETNGGIFQGKASVTEFKLMKKTEYVRNSFSPVIIGKAEITPFGTKINIKMRMMLFICVFVLAWQIPLILIFFSSFISTIVNGISFDAMISCLLSFIMLLALQVLMRLCFYIPAKKAKQWLETYLS